MSLLPVFLLFPVIVLRVCLCLCFRPGFFFSVFKLRPDFPFHLRRDKIDQHRDQEIISRLGIHPGDPVKQRARTDHVRRFQGSTTSEKTR